MVKTPPAPAADKRLTEDERAAVRRFEAKLKRLLEARRRPPDAQRGPKIPQEPER